MNLIQSNIQSISKDQNYNRKSSFQYLSIYKMRERSCERDHDGDLDHLRERERLDHYHNDYHYDRDEDIIDLPILIIMKEIIIENMIVIFSFLKIIIIIL